MTKYRHGYYVLENSKGFFVFDTRLKKGRIFFNKKEAKDITYDTHPKMVNSIIKKGKWNPTSKEIKIKEVKR